MGAPDVSRIILASLATLLVASPAAWSATPQDQQIVVSGTNSQQVHRAVIEAAEKLCRTAIENDSFDDYDQQADCVAETVRAAEPDRTPRVNLANR
jgi:ABC-type metal ion transport system substrate-binding protein